MPDISSEMHIGPFSYASTNLFVSTTEFWCVCSSLNLSELATRSESNTNNSPIKHRVLFSTINIYEISGVVRYLVLSTSVII